MSRINGTWATIADYEGFYASVFYSSFAALGYDVTVEESSSHGRLGRLDLDARVFPDLLADIGPRRVADSRMNRITVRDLLRHSGGFDWDRSGDPQFMQGDIARTLGKPTPLDCADIIAYMKGRQLDFAPGERSVYSNHGYCVLGRVIERASGMSYEAYVRNRVLNPAGAVHARVAHPFLSGRLLRRDPCAAGPRRQWLRVGSADVFPARRPRTVPRRRRRRPVGRVPPGDAVAEPRSLRAPSATRGLPGAALGYGVAVEESTSPRAARQASNSLVDFEDGARIRSPPGLMADERAAEQAGGGTADTAISQPHDKYFQRVFSNEQDAASLLRTCVPRPLADALKWSTLSLLRGRFVGDDWRRNETDMLYSVEREGAETPVLVYVLLEHQSTPDPWLRLRLLGYCVQVWQQWRRNHEDEERLPLLVPMVFYQGAQRWEHTREFADLVTDAAQEWRWVPRFEHLLIDQTDLGAESVTGAVAARALQIAMMAAFRKAPRELLEWVTRLMAELYSARGFEEVATHVEYVLATQPEAQREVFSEALSRNVPGRGGEVMNYVEEMIERGRREGRQEGRQEGRREGQVRAIEGFVARDIPWTTIEAATGIDEQTFRRLRQQVDAKDTEAESTV